MSHRDNHVPVDQLTALAFVARAPEGDDSPENGRDRAALAHVAHCDGCADKLARLTVEADTLRDAAFAEADALFDDARLDVQRGRILDRLAHLGQVARVLRFPRHTREAAMPVSTGSRRWISVAAAAGLIIGLVAGQLLHFVPRSPAVDRDVTASLQGSARPAGPLVILPASAGSPFLSDDELLDEIEAAVQLRPAKALRVFDALTPRAGDLRDPSLGR